MNIALQAKNGTYYIACVKRHANEDGMVVLGKRISPEGKFIGTWQSSSCQDKREAEKRAKELVRIKIKRKGMTPINMEDLPVPVMRHLEVPPEMQVTAEEMVLILRRSKQERYVVFSDVFGLEDYFDAGVEYIGYWMDDLNLSHAPYTIKVYDRYGKLRECFVNRLRSVELTERAIEAGAENEFTGGKGTNGNVRAGS